MTSEQRSYQSDDHAAAPQHSPRSLGSRVRSAAMWALVFLVAVVAAFGTGYFLRQGDVLQLRQQLVEQKAAAEANVAALERRVLEAEKTQLEQELERATLSLTLNRVLAPLPVALAEVDRRNFGNAMERIAAARQALESPEISEAVREVAGARLDAIVDEIAVEMGQFQEAGIRDRLATNAQALERVLVARYDAAPFFTPLAPTPAGPDGSHDGTWGASANEPAEIAAETAPPASWHPASPSLFGQRDPEQPEAPAAPAPFELHMPDSGTPVHAGSTELGAIDEADAEVELLEVAPAVDAPAFGRFGTATSGAVTAELESERGSEEPDADDRDAGETDGRYRWSWELEETEAVKTPTREAEPDDAAVTDPTAPADAVMATETGRKTLEVADEGDLIDWRYWTLTMPDGRVDDPEAAAFEHDRFDAADSEVEIKIEDDGEATDVEPHAADDDVGHDITGVWPALPPVEPST